MKSQIHAEASKSRTSSGKIWCIAKDHWEATRWKEQFTREGVSRVELIPACACDRDRAVEVLGRPVAEAEWLKD